MCCNSNKEFYLLQLDFYTKLDFFKGEYTKVIRKRSKLSKSLAFLMVGEYMYPKYISTHTEYRAIFVLCLVTFTLLHLEIVLPRLEFAKTKLTCLKRDILRLWNLHSLKIASSQQGRMEQK